MLELFMYSTPYASLETLERFLVDFHLDTPRVERALQQAILSHGHELRDNGESVLLQHQFPIVISGLMKHHQVVEFPREDWVIAGLLHDAVEDDKDFTDGIARAEYGNMVADSLTVVSKPAISQSNLLTQQEKYQITADYMAGIRLAPVFPRILKLEDRYNNLASSVSLSKPEKYMRYNHETRNLFLPLAQSLPDEYSPLSYVSDFNFQISRIEAMLASCLESEPRV